MKFKARIYNKFRFKHWFFRFLLVDRIMIKKDNLVLITGKRGDGKTTLALKIILGFEDMEEMEKRYNLEMNKNSEQKQRYKLNKFKQFDLENDMAFTRKDLQDLCKNNFHGFILADEAIVNAARRNSMTKANKILHEVLTINRKNGNTVFFCLPSIEDFDISMLQYVTHWVHIDDRGIGAVLMPEPKSIFGRKTWDIDRMKKIYDKFKEDNPTMASVPYWLFNNFRGYIQFKALPKKVEEKYLEIANMKKNKDSEEEEEKKSKKVQRISEEKIEILKEISDKLISGKINDTAEYYAYCSKIDFDKRKLNKEVSEILAKLGDGRSALRIIKENQEKKKIQSQKEVMNKRVVW